MTEKTKRVRRTKMQILLDENVEKYKEKGYTADKIRSYIRGWNMIDQKKEIPVKKEKRKNGKRSK